MLLIHLLFAGLPDCSLQYGPRTGPVIEKNYNRIQDECKENIRSFTINLNLEKFLEFFETAPYPHMFHSQILSMNGRACKINSSGNFAPLPRHPNFQKYRRVMLQYSGIQALLTLFGANNKTRRLNDRGKPPH